MSQTQHSTTHPSQTSSSTSSPAPAPAPEMQKPLTLIVATTRSLGIGHKGSLPWPQLKGEMAYFARVTKRIVQPSDATPTSQARNAVIMGRKTWDSIPERFRPLKGRVNCVVSRSTTGLTDNSGKDVFFVKSFEEALAALQTSQHASTNGTSSFPSFSSAAAAAAVESPQGHAINSVFVIGGASIYDAALAQQQVPVRVLLTKIRQPLYECDTFFPVDLDSEEARRAGWERQSTERLESVIGETLGDEGAVRREGDVEYEFCLYERTYS